MALLLSIYTLELNQWRARNGDKYHPMNINGLLLELLRDPSALPRLNTLRIYYSPC